MNQNRKTNARPSQYQPSEEDLFNREMLAFGHVADTRSITSQPITFVSNDLYLPGKVARTTTLQTNQH